MHRVLPSEPVVARTVPKRICFLSLTPIRHRVEHPLLISSPPVITEPMPTLTPRFLNIPYAQRFDRTVAVLYIELYKALINTYCRNAYFTNYLKCQLFVQGVKKSNGLFKELFHVDDLKGELLAVGAIGDK